MTGLYDLIDLCKMKNGWIEVDALIIGVVTNASVRDAYCVQVDFMSHLGENITAISNAGCVLDTLDQWTSAIGAYISILYNPAEPREVIIQDVLESLLASQIIKESTGVTISIILSCVLYYYLRLHRRRGGRPPSIEASVRPNNTSESPEERKERILSKLLVAIVPGGGNGKIDASRIRSVHNKLDDSDKTFIFEESDEGGISKSSEDNDSNDGEEESTNEDDEKDDKRINDCLEQTQDDSTTIVADEERHLGASAISSSSTIIPSFLSNLIIRPANHDTNHDASECCICLGCYEPGEVVCVSKSSQKCNHVFHRECLMHWMMKGNDRCPLCRADFMGDDE